MRPQQPTLVRPLSENLFSRWASVSHFGGPNWSGLSLSSPRAVAQAPQDWRLAVKSEDEAELPAEQEVEAADLALPRSLPTQGLEEPTRGTSSRRGRVRAAPAPLLPARPRVGWGPRGCAREGGSGLGRAGVRARVLDTPAMGQEGRPCARVGEAGGPLSSRRPLLRQPTSPATSRGAPRTAWEWPPGSGQLPSG